MACCRHQSSSDCGGVPVSDQNKGWVFSHFAFKYLINCLVSPCTTASCRCGPAETFPLFNATLNALHRGVKVRLLTNNYEEKLCPDMIDPVTFLALAG